MAVSQQKGQESSSCPVHGAGCFCSLSLAGVGILTILDRTTVSNRIDTFVSESETEQQKAKASFSHAFLCRLRLAGVRQT